MSRYANKRQHVRASNGQFRKTKADDLGLRGVCPTCEHLLMRHYDGDERQRPLDPAKWVERCFTCEPYTEAEQALQAEIAASRPQPKSILDILIASEAKAAPQASMFAAIADDLPLFSGTPRKDA